MRLLPPKATLVILTLVALMKAPDAMPAFKNYKVLDFNNIPAVLDFTQRKASAAPIDDEQLRLHPDKDPASYKIFRLSDPSRALDHFFEALQRTETRRPGAITRIVHYGDSPTTADLITGDARKLLQTRFGDAGHGFCLLAKPWAWYGHNGVDLSGSGWSIDPASMSKVKDVFYGLGGVSFRGEAGGHTPPRLKSGKNTHHGDAFLRPTRRGTFLGCHEGEAPREAGAEG